MKESSPAIQAAIANEFACYYHGDELPVVTEPSFRSVDLPRRAFESAIRLMRVVDASEAEQVSSLLRVAASDPHHPLITLIVDETLIGWTDDEDTWSVFQQVLRQIADNMDKIRLQ